MHFSRVEVGGGYLQPKHRDATRVAWSFLVSRRQLLTAEGLRCYCYFYIRDENPDTMVLSALTHISCKVGNPILL